MIDKVGKAYTYTGGMPTVKRNPGETVSTRNKSTDGVEVSSFGQVLSKAMVGGDIKKVSETRKDVVQAVKAQIDAGTYRPDIRLLATRLVAAGITRDQI